MNFCSTCSDLIANGEGKERPGGEVEEENEGLGLT